MNSQKHVKTHNNILWLTIVFIIFSLIICLSISCLCNIKPNRARAATIEELKAQVKEAEIAYDTALSEQYAQETRYNEYQETIDYASQRIPELQSQIGDRLKEIYMNRSHVSIIQLLLGSDTLQDFLTNLDYFNKINQKDTDLMAEYAELKEQSEIAQSEIWSCIEESKAAADEAAFILQSTQWAIEQLEAQNIPVNPGGGGGGGDDPDPGGGGGDDPDPDPDPGGGGDLPIPYGEDIVSRAYACIGHPYGWGCAGPDAFDCSGLVSYAYTGQFVHKWSTFTIRDAAGNGLNGWYRTDNPTDGTCCCSRYHCGIYYGGQMIHAPDFDQLVQIGPIQSDMLFYNR